MTPTPQLPRHAHPMPEDIRGALEAAGLGEAYAARPAYQRNDYIGWVNRARQPSTRDERVAQMLEELRAGNVYMHMTWNPTDVALESARTVMLPRKPTS
jgi:uncharacterized protein YdeI (YjbR/CyaY-like superfamily)